MTTQQTNLAAVLYGIGDVRVEPRPVPAPGPGEVLVAIRSVGVCGSDVHYFEHGRIGAAVVREPMVLGHESAGVVVGLGDGVGTRRIGDRVALEPGVPCGVCGQCRRGRYNLCPDVRFFATPPIDGAFARYVIIHESFAHPLPDTLTDDEGALIEPLSVGVWANRRAGTTIGSRVLVTGAGPIGVLAALSARAAGAGQVTILDVNAERLRQAVELGVDQAVQAGPEVDLAALGVDVLLECTGVGSVVAAGIGALRPAGTAVLVGMAAQSDQMLPVATIQSRELVVTGTFRYANTYPEAIALAASGRLPLAGLVGARVPLAQTERALRMGHTDPAVLKTIVAVDAT